VSNAWLRIARTPGLGGRRLLELLPAVGGADGLCATPASQLSGLGLEPGQVQALREPDPALLESDQAWLEAAEHHILGIGEPDYPALLQQIPGPPAVLWVRGDPSALWQPQIALVGSRNPTPGGREHASEFASTLVREGWTITSGLAAGIDVTAHVGALDAGGLTVAVLGTGPDQVYPARHAAVAEAIAASGALVTELPPGSPPRKQHFPSRNRIIAGLSLGVLVIEAALNSGSLITARLAAEQGREVFALPGSLHNPMVKGCHRLIKQGARLAESTKDVTEALAPMAGELARVLKRRLTLEDEPGERPGVVAPEDEELLRDEDYARLWSELGHDPQTQEQLDRRLGLGPRALSSMLLMLELRGLVQTLDGGRVVRRPGGPAMNGP
jgi:DNA processing protein